MCRSCLCDGVCPGRLLNGLRQLKACAGLGVVIRDSAGLVIGALSQKIRLPSSVVMVEALAARRAVMFAKEISVFRVVVEGDSLQVIKAVNNSKLSMSSYGHIIDETRLLSTSFSCCNFVHVQREGNKLAHALRVEQFYLQILMCGWRTFHVI
ncbi:hypothetical protein SO802_012926 [Lithocarpus litseifolius]|uniref:RNase H type-1 domain-containing protein n=1 Tax=Lithocarpus litseifolius TaxID=425828 RepID=A0AAW2D848_9ROSI